MGKVGHFNMKGKRGSAVWYILLGVNLMLLLLLGVMYVHRLQRYRELQEGIAQKVLRFHVLANSDSDEDQELKLAVRDAVGAQMSELLAGAESLEACEELVKEHLEEIEQTAETILAEEGCGYAVQASLEETDFPVRTYGSYTFPAGTYEALNVVIGEGAGHNWWCVMYPNMCFSGSVYEVVDEEAGEALREVLTEEEYRRIFSSGNYEVRFKYLSFLLDYLEKSR